MLEFMTALLVVFLYPDSLLLPAIHGFTVQLFAVIFGTIVGDWVDVYPRMKGASGKGSKRGGRRGKKGERERGRRGKRGKKGGRERGKKGVVGNGRPCFSLLLHPVFSIGVSQ